MNEKQQLTFNFFKNILSTKQGNMFITGGAGTGKSWLLKEIIKELNQNSVLSCITAMTGIASVSLGVFTLHSKLIGNTNLTMDFEKIIEKISKKWSLLETWTTIEILLIDEISMMSGEMFELLDKIGQRLRKNNQLFGGINLILCGDFLQLGPVEKNKYIFETETWQKYFTRENIFNLTVSQRHSNTQWFELLERIRFETYTNSDIETLIGRKTGLGPNSKGIILLCKNDVVDKRNKMQLNKLLEQHPLFTFNSFIDITPHNDALTKILTPPNVEVCVGARVMHTINVPEMQLANGSCGTVVECNKEGVKVKFDDLPNVININIITKMDKIKDGRIFYSITTKFLPLKLCWAITIHKSQGLTLEKAFIDVSGAFAYGQVYTALSRVKSLDGIFLIGFNTKGIKVCNLCKEFYLKLL